jgi:DNA-directed RNA polymerase subunit RPC12/RpoP
MKVIGNIRDVFKTLKHQKPTQIFCPKCGSPKLSLSSSLDYWLTPQKYVCAECGYRGTIFMELEKEEEEK